MTPESPGHTHASVPPWRDIRVLRIVAQVVVLLVVGVIIALAVRNMLGAMEARGLGFGFGFLNRSAGFEIPESPVPYRSTDTYGQAFLVGLLNTLFVSVVGIVLATVLGIIVGVARLSPELAGEQDRRRLRGADAQHAAAGPAVPHLLRRLPPAARRWPTRSACRRVGVPQPARRVRPGAAGPGRHRGLDRGRRGRPGHRHRRPRILAGRRELAGRPVPGLRLAGLGAFALLIVAGWIVIGPFAFELPVRERFNFAGGLRLSPEFSALLVGLVIYTAAFIGEVVRGGIQAVRRGQWEAARALGLSEGQTLRLVVFPQAMRIIVPPLTSQYLNLAKNSSLAIAIGYPDLFKVGQTMANQTGQPVPVIVLVMGTYLAISLVTSLLMNLYNRRVQVLER